MKLSRKVFENFDQNLITWFGKSQVTDRHNNPLIVYHGSPDTRDIKKTGLFMTPNQKYKNTPGDDQGVFFFTSDYSCAKSYADPKRAFDYQGCEEGVIPVYLKMENPYIFDNYNQSWKGTRKLVDDVKAEGKYDGIIIKNTKDHYNNTDRTKSTTVYVVFYPNQIKSASKNKGEYDAKSNNIYEMKHIRRMNEGQYDNSRGMSYWGDFAAGVLPICTETGRILVGLRSEDVNEPYTWNLFGGKIEDRREYNRPELAAQRELREESGMTGKLEVIPAYVYKTRGFSYANFIGLVTKEFEPILDWEHEDAVWMTLDELKKLEPKHFGLKALMDNSMDIIEQYAN